MEPLVSICIPCYNAADFLEETLKSVLNQSYKNLEIIICDDQSKDNSLEVAKSISDPRITIHLNEKNLGCSGNYERVLSYATGKYTKLMCADDILTPDCLEKQVNAFENNPDRNIVMVTGDRHIIRKDGRVFMSRHYPGTAGIKNGKKAIKSSVRFGTSIFGEPGVQLMLTDAVRKVENVTTAFCNDLDIFFQVIAQGNLYVIKEKLFSFRIIPTSQTSITKNLVKVNSTKEYFSSLKNRPQFGITRFDLALSSMMIVLTTIARSIVIGYMQKGKHETAQKACACEEL